MASHSKRCLSCSQYVLPLRELDRGRLRQNRDRNFALNGTKGEVGVSLKKFFFFRETHFHFVSTQTQAMVTIYYHCIIFSFKLMAIVCVMANLLLNTENAIILRYNFSLFYCHFSRIFLEGEVTSPYCQGSA